VKYLLAAVSAGALMAQVTSGALIGRVSDPSGAALPMAVVVLENPARGINRVTRSGLDGEFRLAQVAAGAYTLRVTAPNFADAEIQAIRVAPGETRREDVALALAGVRTSTEVAAAKDAAPSGLTLDSERIRSLPLNRRDFLQLALLAPGVTPPAQDSELSSRGAFAMHASGAREEFNQYLLDGVDNNDPYNNRFIVQPPVETIQEFRVETNGYGAEFGRSAGGQINIITRAGTNEWHGEAYEYFRNRGLDARNFFEGRERAKFQRNQFGGALGGPLRRDRAFFHANYGGLIERRGLPRLGVVPSAAQRGGDLASLGRTIVDPFAQRPFPGNVIPPSRIHPLSARVLALFPATNQAQPVLRDSAPQASARADWKAGAKDEFNARFTFATQDLFEPYAEEAQSIPGFGNGVVNRGQSAMVHHARALSPSLLHSLRLGYVRGFREVKPENHRRDIRKEWGVSWLNVAPRDFGYPLINVQGFSSIGDATQLPLGRISNTYQLTETLQRQQGKHALKMGFDARRQEANGYLDYFARGQLTFGGALTGAGLGDLLLGFPQTAIQSQFDNQQTLRSLFSGLWAQDDWRATRRLTVNAGLRWEYFTPATDRFDRMSAFDPATLTLARVGTQGVARGVIRPDRNNFAPRVGAAYALNSNTTLRAGYGVFFDAGMFVVNSSHYFNPPFFNIRVWFPAAGVFPSLTNPFPSNGGIVPPATLNTLSPDAATTYLQHFSFSIERQVSRSTTFSAAYVASKGSKLARARDLNQPLPGAGSAQANRPLPRFGGIFFIETGANSNYHSLQLNVNRRLARGVSLLGSYTFGKSIDDASSFLGSGPDRNFPQNSRNYAAERALSSFDMRQRFAGTATWEFARGFEARGIFTAQSGQPLTPYLRFDNSNTGNTGGTFGNDRPNVTGDWRLSNRSAERWFRTEAFATPARFTFGDAGRNILAGPALATVDASVARTFRVERLRFTLSVEAFNLLNRVNLEMPERFVDEPSTFGRVLSARASRQAQVSLRILF